MNFFDQIRIRMKEHGAPGTVLLIALMIASFLMHWIVPIASWPPLSMATSLWPSEFWTVLSYPLGLSNGGILALILGSMWLYGMGGIVERDMSTTRFLKGAIAFTLLCGLSFWLGSKLAGIPATLSGFWLLLSAVTVAWGSRYPTSMAMFMFFIPIQARWLAWISVLLVFFGTVPQLALFSAAPLAVVWLFASSRLPVPYSGGLAEKRRSATKTRSGMIASTEFLADVRKREQEREERERLRKLFESGMIDNEGDEGKPR